MQALAAWTDSRFGTEGTGRQDIIAATVSRKRAGALDWVSVALLAVLGAVSVVVALLLGRRATSAPKRPDSRRAKTEPATARSELAGPLSRP